MYERYTVSGTMVLSGGRGHQWTIIRVHCGTRLSQTASTVCIKKDGWLGYVKPDSPEIPATPCVRWWELSIMANGIVSLCCMDGEGKFSIGDVKENSMLEIYNQPEYRERREKLLSRKNIYPCNTCTY